MTPMFYSVLHVASGILLVAYTFQAFAAPTPERRRPILTATGIAALVMLVSGFGLLAKLDAGFPGYVFLKLACWLVLSMLAGIAFKRSEKAGLLTGIAIIAVLLAVWAVYYKPF